MALRINTISELTLLYLCVRDINTYYYLNSQLSAADFQDSRHRVIYNLFGDLTAAGVSELSTDQLYSIASEKDLISDMGGVDYFMKAVHKMKGVGTSLENVNKHLNTVKTLSKAVQVRDLLEQKAKALNRENIDDTVDSIVDDLLFLDNRIKNDDNTIDASEFISDFIETLDDTPPVELSGMSSGFVIFDDHIDGLVPGTLTVIAAQKKMGKSVFLTNIAAHTAINLETPVLYIDTEMTAQEWALRLLAHVSKVEERKIKRHQMNDLEKQNVLAAEYKLRGKKLHHHYMPGFSMDKIVALVNRFYRKEKIGLVIFDYIKEPDSSSTSSLRNEYQILGDVTTKLKDLAGKLEIPILTAAQLNRNGDIADSYKILRYADVICFWDRRTEDELDAGGGFEGCGNYKLVIKDSRRGGTTTPEGIGYKFYKKVLTIREVPIDQQYFLDADDRRQESDDMDNYLDQPLT